MKLLLTGSYPYTNGQIKQLESMGFNVQFIQNEMERITGDVSDVDLVVCNSLFLYNNIQDFKSLKAIQLTSAGMDRIPLDYIEKNSIKVFNAKDVYSIPIAEWVILKILEIYKKSKIFYENQKIHSWEKQRDLIELSGKTASIIGLGNIGMEVAKRLKPFGVRIIGVDLNQFHSENIDTQLVPTEIDVALTEADITILTLPLNTKTHHLMDMTKLNMMKDKSVLVNVSRGSIIDENALIDSLANNKFLGVALDVFEQEPLKESRLWDFDNVIVTPHNSFVSDNINSRLFELILANFSEFT